LERCENYKDCPRMDDSYESVLEVIPHLPNNEQLHEL
jgi:hypothetical protein